MQQELDVEEERVAKEAHAEMEDRRTLREIMLSVEAKQDEILRHLGGSGVRPSRS